MQVVVRNGSLNRLCSHRQIDVSDEGQMDTQMKFPAIAIAGVTCLIIGCSSMPTVTGTGVVKEIVIRNHVTPTELTANPGDEIRWINKSMAPVRIIFLESVEGKLSCKQGFAGFMVPTESATLGPNESASVCFHNPGSIRYAVTMKSATPSEEMNVSGLIHIGASPSEKTGALSAPAAIPAQ